VRSKEKGERQHNVYAAMCVSRAETRAPDARAETRAQRRARIYKDGAVFPRPGLAGVPHVQHMGTMNVSWAPASPPSSMAMVAVRNREEAYLLNLLSLS
jgi:hypothetical protein